MLGRSKSKSSPKTEFLLAEDTSFVLLIRSRRSGTGRGGFEFGSVRKRISCRKNIKFCEAILEACSANSNASSRGDRSEGRASGGSSLVLSGALSSQEHLVVHVGDTKQGGLPVRSLKEQTVCSTGNRLRHHEKVLQYLGGRLTQPDQIQPKGRHGCAQSTHLASGHLAAHQHLRQ